ncbi:MULTISPECIES: hypothetical protein [unclassified Desulfovibrio]|uniref:hypothetical protein n=1 Tax=unclassified Desulfovibrio TaxID=2593640 RepID=UPI0013ED0057|nr:MULTISPECIES: hypothetical protein [unclassified Desulfovibrio]
MAALLFREEGLAPSLNLIVIVQFLILCFAIVFLYSALLPSNASCVELILYGLILLLGLYIAPPASMRWILSESLGQSTLFIWTASVLLFHKTNKIFFLYLSCFFALYTFLIRPVALAALIISTFYLIYLFYKKRLKRNIEYEINGIILLFGYVYIMFLSLTCGNLCFGTIQYQVSVRRIAYFLEEKDIQNMPTSRSKILAEKLLNEKIKNYDQVESDLKKRYRNKPLQSISLPTRYNHFAEIINDRIGGVYWKSSKEWRNPAIKYSLLDLTHITREIENGLSINHSRELAKVRVGYFLSTLGVVKDWRPGVLARKGIAYSISALVILVLAFMLCKDIRFLIIVLVSTHQFSVLAVAYSHIMLERYYTYTEPIYIIAILVALYGLLKKVFMFVRGRYLSIKRVAPLLMD